VTRGLPPDDPVVAIAGGGLHSLALTRRGRVYAWGADTFGQLGPAGAAPYSAAPYSAVPVVVALVHAGAPDALAGGIAHSAAVMRDGAVRTWGDDSVGQLGYIDNSRAPLAVRGLPAGDPVAALAAGGLHNLALTRAGLVYAWGDDSAGQLGVVGQGYISSVPLGVTGFPAGTPIVAVAAGYSHSLALTRDGEVYAWGADTFGQLGDGGVNDSGVPVIVRGLPPRDPVVALAGGHNDSLALTRSGQIYAWGGGAGGELGDGATRDSVRPVPVRATWQG